MQAKRSRISSDLRGPRGICTPSLQEMFKLFSLEKFLIFFYIFMCRFSRLNFCTYCALPLLCQFGPARACWLNPMCYVYKPAGASPSLPSATRLTKTEGSPLGTAQATRPTNLQGRKARSEHPALKARASRERLLVRLSRNQ